VVFALLISCSTLYTLVGTQTWSLAQGFKARNKKQPIWDFISIVQFQSWKRFAW